MQLPTGSAVLATSHPNATAFAARFLANPEDRLGRLVFADWLEERGGESNLAWAQYLREVAQIEEEFGGEYAQQAESLGRAVRARLTLGYVPGTPLLSRLQLFLPPHRIWVRISSDRIPLAVTEDCQGNVARLYGFMPIGRVDARLFVVATAEPFDTVRPDVENFLSMRLTAFRGESSDVAKAILAHYGQSAFDVEDTSPDF